MFYNRNKIGLALLSCLSVQLIQMTLAFSVFPAQKNMCRYVPTIQDDNVDIELPDFDQLFQTIREVSPLASLAMNCETGGFDVADQKCKSLKISFVKLQFSHKISNPICNNHVEHYRSILAQVEKC